MMEDLKKHIEFLNSKKDDLIIDKAFGKDISEETESLNQMINNTEQMIEMKKAQNGNLETGFLKYARF